MSDHNYMIPVMFRPASHVVTLLEHGKLSNLSGTQTAVLRCFSDNANDDYVVVHLSGGVIARRTNFGHTAITNAIADLLRLKLIAPAGCDSAGVKSYRLTLPSIGQGAAESAPVNFDPSAYVESRVGDLVGIAAEEVRQIVKYHLQVSTNKFWVGQLTSKAKLLRHLPTMRKQYLGRPLPAAPRRTSSYIPRVDETQDDYAPRRKGERFIRHEEVVSA